MIGRLVKPTLDRNGLKVDKAWGEWEERVVAPRGLDPHILQPCRRYRPRLEHIPGASRLKSQAPPPLDDVGQPRRVAFYPHRGDAPIHCRHRVSAIEDLLLPEGKEDGFYINAFLSEFGATREKPAIFKDVLGESLVISDALFTSRAAAPNSKNAGVEVYPEDFGVSVERLTKSGRVLKYHLQQI